eukprot:6169116-Pyramimonas_sp.AAC.1
MKQPLSGVLQAARKREASPPSDAPGPNVLAPAHAKAPARAAGEAREPPGKLSRTPTPTQSSA